MPNLSILSAGAAQSVVIAQIEKLQTSGVMFNAIFGAVHTIKARVLGDEAVDVVILTRDIVDALCRAGRLRLEPVCDLGPVATGIAVHAHMPAPVVNDVASLRSALLRAVRIICPTPAGATAGRVLVDALRLLEMSTEVESKLVFCASGLATLEALVAEASPDVLAVAQVTEILADDSVVMSGMLPWEVQQPTVYTAAVTANAENAERACDFVRQLTMDPAALRAAGFGLMPGISA